MEAISSNKSFGGWNRQYSHFSDVLGCQMRLIWEGLPIHERQVLRAALPVHVLWHAPCVEEGIDWR